MDYIIDTDKMRNPDSMESFVENFNLHLSENYIAKSNTATILLGLLCVACFVLAVVFIKKSRGMGIAAAVMQFIGLFAAQRSVIAYSKIDFSEFFVIEYGSTYDEAYGKAMDSLFDAYLAAAPAMLSNYLWSFLMLAAAIISLIYIGGISKAKGKVLAVFAFIFTILRILLPSVQLFTMFTTGLSQASQQSWDGVYRFIYVFPAVLIGVMALINIKSSVPEAGAPIVVEESDPAVNAEPAVEAAPEEEIPAEETVSTNE